MASTIRLVALLALAWLAACLPRGEAGRQPTHVQASLHAILNDAMLKGQKMRSLVSSGELSSASCASIQWYPNQGPECTMNLHAALSKDVPQPKGEGEKWVAKFVAMLYATLDEDSEVDAGVTMSTGMSLVQSLMCPDSWLNKIITCAGIGSDAPCAKRGGSITKCELASKNSSMSMFGECMPEGLIGTKGFSSMAELQSGLAAGADKLLGCCPFNRAVKPLVKCQLTTTKDKCASPCIWVGSTKAGAEVDASIYGSLYGSISTIGGQCTLPVFNNGYDKSFISLLADKGDFASYLQAAAGQCKKLNGTEAKCLVSSSRVSVDLTKVKAFAKLNVTTGGGKGCKSSSRSTSAAERSHALSAVAVAAVGALIVLVLGA